MEGHFPCNFGFISLANNLVEFSKRLPSPHHFKNCFSVVSQPLYTIAGYRLLLNGSWCAWMITTSSTESVITGGLATAASRTERKIQVRLPKEQGGEERLCQKIVEFLGPPHTQLFPCFYTKHSSPRTPITYDPSFRPRADHLLNLCFSCCFAGLCPRLSSFIHSFPTPREPRQTPKLELTKHYHNLLCSLGPECVASRDRDLRSSVWSCGAHNPYYTLLLRSITHRHTHIRTVSNLLSPSKHRRHGRN